MKCTGLLSDLCSSQRGDSLCSLLLLRPTEVVSHIGASEVQCCSRGLSSARRCHRRSQFYCRSLFVPFVPRPQDLGSNVPFSVQTLSLRIFHTPISLSGSRPCDVLSECLVQASYTGRAWRFIEERLKSRVSHPTSCPELLDLPSQEWCLR